MESHVGVPVSTARFLALVDFLREQGDDRDPVEAVGHAIDYWVDNMSLNPNKMLAIIWDDDPELGDSRGYTWKHKDSQLFLPNSTEVRMRYKDSYYYAKIEGDQIIYEGISVSPATLVNTITGTSRNAWRDLWIKRPSDNNWCLADDLRRRRVTHMTAEELGL